MAWTPVVCLLESWRGHLDNKEFVGTVLMDLSKAFDCLPHDLLIAKLEAYGFSNSSLLLIYDYLSGRKQRVKIGSEYSTWMNINLGVPQIVVVEKRVSEFKMDAVSVREDARLLTGI